MQEIKCPNCGKMFSLEEKDYLDILKQVKTKEFNDELNERLLHINNQHQSEIELTKQKTINEYEKQMAINQQELIIFENKIADLESKSEVLIKEKELAMQELLNAKEKEIQSLTSQMQIQSSNNELEKTLIKEKHEMSLKQKDELIDYYKDFKAKQSTKMIGENLEQHCEYEFNKNRMGAFKNAEFKKDNDASSGSKGDYIYREYDEHKNEIISIMFEMKNENDETATKKKNEHFFKELDKDRREKKCEYAILVSLLESDSELYNNGIVDVSYEYEKMYVIRPQFFVPMITLLRNAALNSLEYKQQLAIIKEQNIDITNFESDLNNFKESFSKNYEMASKKFKTAIDEIDKTISHLQKTKDALLSSENNLRLANNKADDISIKKLVRNNPTMKDKFKEIE